METNNRRHRWGMVHVTSFMFKWCKQEKACNISKYNCHKHSSEFYYYINVLTKTYSVINIKTEAVIKCKLVFKTFKKICSEVTLYARSLDEVTLSGSTRQRYNLYRSQRKQHCYS